MTKGNQAPQKAKGSKILRSLLLLLLLAFVAIQFFQPDKNNQSLDMTHDISTVVTVPDSVHSLLKIACYDCHSNNTNYPWYANIQPIGWWIKDHIDEGKSHLNFQEFALVEPRPNSKFNTRVLRQDHKLEEVVEQIESGEMPFKSYTYMHKQAEINAEEAKMIMDWVGNARNELMRDSLVAPVSKL